MSGAEENVSTIQKIGLNDSTRSNIAVKKSARKENMMQRTKSGVIKVKVKQYKTSRKPHLRGFGEESLSSRKSLVGTGTIKKTLRSKKFRGSNAFQLEGSTTGEEIEDKNVEEVNIEDEELDPVKDLVKIAAMKKRNELMMSKKQREKREKFPFSAKWESTEVELDAFMSELNLSNKFSKLAMAFGGDVKQELKIKQFGEEGDHFVITENNERRKIKYVVNIGEEFVSFNENDEEIDCISRWGDDKREFVIEEKNKSNGEITVIKRRVYPSQGTLVELRKQGDSPEASRTYERAGDDLKLNI